MSSTRSSLTITGRSPPQLSVTPVDVGQIFASTDDLRLAVERSFMRDGRGMKADKRVGGGKSKLYRCAGAEWDTKRKGKGSGQETERCQALMRAYELKTAEWKITEPSLEHVLCAGGAKNASSRALEEEASNIINANRSITVSSLQDTLQAHTRSVRMSDRTAHRLRERILGIGQEESSETYQMLYSFLHYISNSSGGSVTDCQCDAKGGFLRCFMTLGSAAYFSSQGVQKVSSVDAAHLKGTWNGVMLTLSFKDSNNNIVHVATAICPKEDRESYVYLLENAKKFEPLGIRILRRVPPRLHLRGRLPNQR